MACEKGVASPFLKDCEIPLLTGGNANCIQVEILDVYVDCSGNGCYVTVKISNAAAPVSGSIVTCFEDLEEGVNICLTGGTFTNISNGTMQIPVPIFCQALMRNDGGGMGNVGAITTNVIIPGIAASPTFTLNYEDLPVCGNIDLGSIESRCSGGSLQDITFTFDAVATSGNFQAQVLISGVWTNLGGGQSLGNNQGNVMVVMANLPDGSYTFRIIDADSGGAIVSNQQINGFSCSGGGGSEEIKITDFKFQCNDGNQTVDISFTYSNMVTGTLYLEYESSPGMWGTVANLGLKSGTGSETMTVVLSPTLTAGPHTFRINNTSTGLISVNTVTDNISDCAPVPEPIPYALRLGRITLDQTGPTKKFDVSSYLYLGVPIPNFSWLLQRYDGGGSFTTIVNTPTAGSEFNTNLLEEDTEYLITCSINSNGLYASSTMMFKTITGILVTDQLSVGQNSLPNQPGFGEVACIEDINITVPIVLKNPNKWELLHTGAVGTGTTVNANSPTAAYFAGPGIRWNSLYYPYSDITSGIFTIADDTPSGYINAFMQIQK